MQEWAECVRARREAPVQVALRKNLRSRLIEKAHPGPAFLSVFPLVISCARNASAFSGPFCGQRFYASNLSRPVAPAEQATPAPVSFELTGVVRAGKLRFRESPSPRPIRSPARNCRRHRANGTYTFTGLPRGRYVVRVEFMGFSAQTQEIVLKPETPAGKFDAEMVLASRQQDQSGLGNLAASSPQVADFRVWRSTIFPLSPAAELGNVPGMMGGGQNGNGDMFPCPEWRRSGRPDGIREHYRSARRTQDSVVAAKTIFRSAFRNFATARNAKAGTARRLAGRRRSRLGWAAAVE